MHWRPSNAPKMAAANRIRYACDLDKSVLINNFEKRGWVPVGTDEDWNFYWLVKSTLKLASPFNFNILQ